MAKGFEPASDGGSYRVGRELGSRAERASAAIREPHELVVIHRFAHGDASRGLGAEAMNQIIRDAECLAKNWHPNIARVKHVDGDAMRLTIATDFIDGMTLADLFAEGSWAPLLPPPVMVRILVDVLAGLNALHALRDGTRAVGTIHGAVSPANIVVGKDGIARIVSCVRRRPVRVDAGSEALAYASPEALDEGGTKDLRSDVYAVGVILWEALMGLRPYEGSVPAQLLARQRSEEVVTPTLDASSPFAGLGEIAMRAMAFEPALRFRTAAEMATALRKLSGPLIATGSAVATTVTELGGDRIRARRAELDPPAPPKRPRAEPEPDPASPAPAPAVAPAPAPRLARPVPPSIRRTRVAAVAPAPAPVVTPPSTVVAVPAVVPTPALPVPASSVALAAPPPLAPIDTPPAVFPFPVTNPADAQLASTSTSPSALPSTSEPAPSRQRRRRAAVLVLLAGALLIILVASIRTVSGGAGPSVEPSGQAHAASSPTAAAANAANAAPDLRPVAPSPSPVVDTAPAALESPTPTAAADPATAATSTAAPDDPVAASPSGPTTPARHAPAAAAAPSAGKPQTYDPLGI